MERCRDAFGLSRERFASAEFPDRIAAALRIHPPELFTEDPAAIEAMRIGRKRGEE